MDDISRSKRILININIPFRLKPEKYIDLYLQSIISGPYPANKKIGTLLRKLIEKPTRNCFLDTASELKLTIVCSKHQAAFLCLGLPS